MSEGTAVIISALISVGGIVITVVVNLLFNIFRLKTESNERFFYEVYPKRLAAYESVVKELAVMGRKDRDILNPKQSFTYVASQIENDLHILDTLRAGLDLYGSPTARSIVSLLRLEAGLRFRAVVSVPDNFIHECVALLYVVNDTLNKFLELVREEAGANMINKKIMKLKFSGRNKPNKPSKQNKRYSAKTDKAVGNQR